MDTMKPFNAGIDFERRYRRQILTSKVNPRSLWTSRIFKMAEDP